MKNYIVRRLILMIPTMLIVTLIVFFSIRVIPGNIVDIMLAEHSQISGATIASINHSLGFDVPVYTQYGRWLWAIISRGDLGKSLWSGTPVIQYISSRLSVTFELAVLALIVALIISIPIGVYSAIRQDTINDYIGRSVAIFCIAIPDFWLATLVVVFPSLWWKWSPPMSVTPFNENPIKNLGQFIIPSIILGMGFAGVMMRMTRTMMLDVMRNDYIRTAWAKGLKEKEVVLRHAFKNVLIPIITLVGIQLPVLLGGTVIIERIFILPGIGSLLLDSVSQRDYTIVAGILLLIGASIQFINLGIDLTYGYFDPRIRYR